MRSNNFFYKTLYNGKLEVNYSSSFLKRTKCKFCLSGPSNYFYIRDIDNLSDLSVYLKHVRNFINLKMKKINYSYDSSYMSSVKSVTSYQHSVNYKGIKVKSHRKKNYLLHEYIEVLVCKCSQTCWTFNEQTSSNIPESSNRRSRYKTNIVQKKF